MMNFKDIYNSSIDKDIREKTKKHFMKKWLKQGIEKHKINGFFKKMDEYSTNLILNNFVPTVLEYNNKNEIVMASIMKFDNCLEDILSNNLKNIIIKNYNDSGVLFASKRNYINSKNGDSIKYIKCEKKQIENYLYSVYSNPEGINKDTITTDSHFWEHEPRNDLTFR